jgi:hypothetical protein
MKEGRLPGNEDIEELCRRMYAISAAPDLVSAEQACKAVRDLLEGLAVGVAELEAALRQLHRDGYIRVKDLPPPWGPDPIADATN